MPYYINEVNSQHIASYRTAIPAFLHRSKVIAQLRAQVKEYDERIRLLEGRLRGMGKLSEARGIERIKRGQVEDPSSSNQ